MDFKNFLQCELAKYLKVTAKTIQRWDCPRNQDKTYNLYNVKKWRLEVYEKRIYEKRVEVCRRCGKKFIKNRNTKTTNISIVCADCKKIKLLKRCYVCGRIFKSNGGKCCCSRCSEIMKYDNASVKLNGINNFFCETCKKQINDVTSTQLLRIISGDKIYCSDKCAVSVLISCRRCGEKFYYTKYQVKKTMIVCPDCNKLMNYSRCAVCGKVFYQHWSFSGKIKPKKCCSHRCAYLFLSDFSGISSGERFKIAEKPRREQKIKNLSDGYIKKLLSEKRNTLSIKKPSRKIIKLKRQNIKIQREIKKAKEFINGFN